MTCYIDKISALMLDDVFKSERDFDIYIRSQSVGRLYVLTILTKYIANTRC